MSTELDPRWEWIHVPELGNWDQWVRGECNHLTPAPVHAKPTDELVAYLCPDCDAQLPAEWQPDEPPARPHEPGARPTPLSRLLYP